LTIATVSAPAAAAASSVMTMSGLAPDWEIASASALSSRRLAR
jgi:hypothetical protein